MRLARLLLLPLLGLGLLAQDVAPDSDELRPAGLLVRTDPSGPSRPLPVSAVDVDLTVVGRLATVDLDLTFSNPYAQVLEGQLVLPLPSGATVTAMALEIDGQLREAAVVERQKARVVFEEIVRRGVDPGLVEWVQGNVYQVRVYPIPANGTKRCVLRYTWQAGERIRLPLRYGKLDRFSLSVDTDQAETLTPPAVPGGNLDWGDATVSFAADVTDFTADADLELVLPALTEPAVAIQSGSHGRHFSALLPVPAPDGAAATPPARLGILFDASASREPAAIAAELALLRAWVAQLAPEAVKLVAFSNAIWFEEDFGPDTYDQLFARIENLPRDGGTRLSCLDLARYDDSCDALLLCSDGLSTLGSGLPKPGAKPVHAVLSGTSHDRPRLEAIAASGHLLDLTRDAPEACLAQLSQRPWVFLGVESAGVERLSPAAPSRASAEFALSGMLTAEAGTVTCIFGDGSGATWRVPVSLGADNCAAGDTVAKHWARARVGELAPFPERELEVKQIGLKYGIVTPQTSLLVLETLEDYVRYRIVPPAGEWQDAYFAQIEAADKLVADSQAAHMARVRELWKQRKDWYAQTFDYPKDFRFAQPNADGESNDMGGSGGPPAAEAPNASPATPRDSAEPEAGGERLERARESDALEELAASGDDETQGGDAGEAGGPSRSIELKPWTPDMPYMAALQEAGDGAWEVYQRLRQDYANSSAFYLDVADLFVERGEEDRALRVLSNIAELELGSAPLLRILAHRLAQLERLELAAEIFREVLRMRPEEPQSHRDLALVLARMKHFDEAISLFEAVVRGEWDGRFPDIQLVALGELNRCIARCEAAGMVARHNLPDDLIENLACDLRVVLTWDADMCDMDLWVVEPSGEKAYYSHTRTTIGGWFGRDFTRGYGPEEYLLKDAMAGGFQIQVNYYGNSQQMLSGATTIQLTVYKNYGRPDEERISVTRRLRETKQVLDIAEITFE